MAEKRTELQEIKLSALVAATDNPRTVNKSSEKYIELVKSIKINGVVLPLLVRPHPSKKGKFEVRAGHRRLEAAMDAKVKTVPCMVYYGLSDKAAYELTMIENCAREDLTPIEEANTVARMLELNDGDAEVVADKLDKTANWVKIRSRVGKSLTFQWHQFLTDQDWGWSASHLEQIARLPPALQNEVLEVVNMSFSERLRYRRMSVEELRIELRKKFNKLSIAVFDVSKCKACLNRTSSAAFLFPDVAGEDYCLDPACWAKKQQACMQKQIDQALAEGCVFFVWMQADFDFDYRGAEILSYWPGYAGGTVVLDKPEDMSGYKKVFIVSGFLTGQKFGDVFWWKKDSPAGVRGDGADADNSDNDDFGSRPSSAMILNAKVKENARQIQLTDKAITNHNVLLLRLLILLSEDLDCLSSDPEFCEIKSICPDDLDDADKVFAFYKAVFRLVKKQIENLSEWQQDQVLVVARWLGIDVSDIDLNDDGE
jgi:ParB/RepB/Spo0J family partition protein